MEENQEANFLEAEVKSKQILHLNGNHPEAWRNLGTIYYIQGKYQDALEMLQQSLDLDSSSAITYYSLGLVLEKIGYLTQAVAAYEKALQLNPQSIEVYHTLGNVLSEMGEFEQAEATYLQAIALDENNHISYLNLGNLLIMRQQIDEAIALYDTALQLNPNNTTILNSLGIAFAAKNEPVQASFYFGSAAYYQGEYEQASDYYQNYLKTQNRDVDIYLRLSLCLQECGQTQEAIKVINDALTLLPNETSLKLENLRILPIIYDNREEIEFYRNRFTQGLAELVQQTSLETPESKETALKGISCRTNFYLQYQGLNDLKYQKQYGEFVHNVMVANYPQWVKQLPIVPLGKDGKIRIGYISDCFHWHTVGMVFLGWIKNCQKEDFHISCYYINSQIDRVTEEFQQYSDRFHHIPDNLEAVAEQILADKLHILVFLDIGMTPQMMQLAALKLAPVQCAAWGHPVTTGLPTIDYFLSSDLMEPKNAQEHYSEQLIPLPNIGISYSKPIITETTKTRFDFQLREDAVIYLSCQSLFKYLPQYDYIFGEIAQKVSQSQFVFIAHQVNQITEQFRQRIQRAFAEFGLNSEDYCIILSRQSQQDYRNLNLLADVFLDTFGFTGFLTTLESIACNLPVVTCRGEIMRSRQSYGILKMLGITDTIARNEAEYIQIAVKLGLDKETRHTIVERIKHCQASLYDDKTCVAALEEFYRRIISG